MPQTFLRALLVVLIGGSLGLASNALRRDANKDGVSRRLPWVTPPKAQPTPKDVIVLADAKALWDTGASFFLDARAQADFNAGHIAGALSLPVETFDEAFPTVAKVLSPDSAIVCYCDGVECELSHRLVEMLHQRGYTNVRLVVNGWTEWTKAGWPTQKGDHP